MKRSAVVLLLAACAAVPRVESTAVVVFDESGAMVARHDDAVGYEPAADGYVVIGRDGSRKSVRRLGIAGLTFLLVEVVDVD